jgi:hypothetical protein
MTKGAGSRTAWICGPVENHYSGLAVLSRKRRDSAPAEVVMITLIVTVCALVNASECHDETFYFESHGTLASCMFAAPPYMAEWSANHPKWTIRKWKCDWPDQSKT